jgi:hypothetical protein
VLREVVRDTYGADGKIDPELRQVVSSKLTRPYTTSIPAYITSFLHYREEREESVHDVPGESNKRVQERTVEIISRG